MLPKLRQETETAPIYAKAPLSNFNESDFSGLEHHSFATLVEEQLKACFLNPELVKRVSDLIQESARHDTSLAQLFRKLDIKPLI